MRKISLYFFCVLAVASFNFSFAQVPVVAPTAASIIEYRGSSSVVRKQIIPLLEKEIEQCRRDFECPYLANEPKVKIRYFADKHAYAGAGGLQSTSICYSPEKKELLIDAEGASAVMERAISHEAAHIVMCMKRERLEVGRLPTVFEEGVAITREGESSIAQSVFSSLMPRLIPEQAKELAFDPVTMWMQDEGPSGVTYRQSGSLMAFLMAQDISRNELFGFGMGLARLNKAGKQAQAKQNIRQFIASAGFKNDADLNANLQKRWKEWELEYVRTHAKDWAIFKKEAFTQLSQYKASFSRYPAGPEKKAALQQIETMKNAINEVDDIIKK